MAVRSVVALGFGDTTSPEAPPTEHVDRMPSYRVLAHAGVVSDAYRLGLTWERVGSCTDGTRLVRTRKRRGPRAPTASRCIRSPA